MIYIEREKKTPTNILFMCRKWDIRLISLQIASLTIWLDTLTLKLNSRILRTSIENLCPESWHAQNGKLMKFYSVDNLR